MIMSIRFLQPFNRYQWLRLFYDFQNKQWTCATILGFCLRLFLIESQAQLIGSWLDTSVGMSALTGLCELPFWFGGHL